MREFMKFARMTVEIEHVCCDIFRVLAVKRVDVEWPAVSVGVKKLEEGKLASGSESNGCRLVATS